MPAEFPPSNIDDLLVKHLLGEASRQESKTAEDWINQSADNKAYYEHFRQIWQTSRAIASVSQVDEIAAWERLKKRMEKLDVDSDSAILQESVTVKKSALLSMKPWRVAAAAMLVVLAGILSVIIYRGTFAIQEQQLLSSTVPLQQKLDDGSVVTLNKSSALYYPERFSGKKRKVRLKGEAFFSVKPNPEKEFEVEVNGITVSVLGTSFNIKESIEGTEIVVETGRVMVSKNNSTIVLNAGEKIDVSNDSSPWQKKQQEDKLYQYYRTRSFTCDHTPLWKLALVLQEAYGVEIVMDDPSIRNLPLTTVFEDRPLDEIISIIEQTLQLKAVRKEGKIYLQPSTN